MFSFNKDSRVLTSIGAATVVGLFVVRNVQYVIKSHESYRLRGKCIQFINATDEDMTDASSILPCWLGKDITIKKASIVRYPDADIRSVEHALKKDACDAFEECGARGPCLLMKTFATIGGNEDFDYVGSPEDLAKRCAGQTMLVTCIAALALGKDRLVIHKNSVEGVVCSASEARLRQAKSVVHLFNPSRPSSIVPLESDLFSRVKQCDSKLASDGDENASLSHAARWDRALSLARERSRGDAPFPLILNTVKWRTLMQLGEDIRYGEMRRATVGFRQAFVESFASIGRSFISMIRGFRPKRLLGPQGQAERNELTSTFHIGAQDFSNPLHGRFENHVTVRIGSSTELDRFQHVCRLLGVKVVMIALPEGATFQEQAMTSYYTSGSVGVCAQALYEIGHYLAFLGFDVQRLKMELQLSEDVTRQPFLMPAKVGPQDRIGICPLSDDDAASQEFMSHLQYYEFHVKVRIPEERAVDALTALKQTAVDHNAHLSRNAFRPYIDQPGTETPHRLHFLTLRVYQRGFASCLTDLQRLSAAVTSTLEPFGGSVATMMREFSVFDSNTGLDAGWIALP